MEDWWNFQYEDTFLTLGGEEHKLAKSEPGGSFCRCRSLKIKRTDPHVETVPR
jgi:hypothetical protein